MWRSTQLIRSAALGLAEAACGTSAIAAVGFSGLYSGVHGLTEVLADRPLAAALSLWFASLRLLGPAPAGSDLAQHRDHGHGLARYIQERRRVAAG